MSLQAKISNDTSSLPLDDKANLLQHIFKAGTSDRTRAGAVCNFSKICKDNATTEPRTNEPNNLK